MDDDREQRIKDRAHDLWEQAGRPHGLDQEHWSQAEQELDEGGDRSGAATAHDAALGDGDAAVVATEKRKTKKV